jgi:hypothetical protein
MIVVVGSVSYLEEPDAPGPHGIAARITLTAASLGNAVQFVGKVGEDDAGDAVVLALAKGGVGHVAVLREAGIATAVTHPAGDESVEAEGATLDEAAEGPALDAADVELALRYLTDFAVLVLVARADGAIATVVSEAANWAGARLVVVMPLGAAIPGGLPGDAIVFEAPDADPDGVFASMVGTFAAALDDGDEPGQAFRSTVSAEGWTAAPDDAGEETRAPDPA